jgi:cell division protease FtsH
MVTVYGMNDNIGPISLKNENGEVEYNMFGENLEDKIGAEVKKLIDTAYRDAQIILTQNMDKLDKVAQILLEKEKINEEEFNELMGE